MTDAIPPPGNTEAKLLLWIALTAAGWILMVFHLVWLPRAMVPSTYLLPIILALSLVLAVRLVRQGTASVPPALGLLGILFIVGGGIFDMVATVIHTPGLHEEGNLVVRALLDSGHPLTFVYGYAIGAQAMYLALVCTLWVALLRHRSILVATLRGQPSFLRFMKAATGGAHLTWRQWNFPLKASELPRAYHLFWLLVVILVAGAVDRWYLGLEWFKLISSTRWIVAGVACSVGLVVYFAWLRLASSRRTTMSTDDSAANVV